jgi:WD40 repeat protein
VIDNAHEQAVSVVKWLDTSAHVFVSTGYEGHIKFWDTRLGLAAPVLQFHRLHIGCCTTICVSDDMTQMVSGGADASIKMTEIRYSRSAASKSDSNGDAMWLQQYRYAFLVAL